MTEMEQRVMEAIDANTQRCDQNFDLLTVAQSAIRAMREPSELMIVRCMETGGEPYLGPSARIIFEMWRVMIDAASPA